SASRWRLSWRRLAKLPGGSNGQFHAVIGTIMPVQIRKLDSADPGFREQLAAVLAFEAEQDDAIDSAAARILADVKARGDAAVLEFTSRFDQVQADSVAALEVGQAELKA